MIYCKSCDNFFDEDEAESIVNYVPYGNTKIPESSETICPYCNGNDLLFEVRPVICNICGEIIPDVNAFRDGDYFYCENCYDDTD